MDVGLSSILRVFRMAAFADRPVLRSTDAGSAELGVCVHKHRRIPTSKCGRDRFILLLVTLQVQC